MIELFKYNPDFEERKDKIVTSIYDYIEKEFINGIEELFLVDPYFDSKELLKLETDFNTDLYIYIFYELILLGATKIRILTRSGTNNIFANFSGINLENKFTKKFSIEENDELRNVEVKVRYAREHKTRLHDRWLIIGNKDKKIGFHLGTTLHRIQNKDLTITKFINIDNFLEHFNDIYANGR